MFHTNLSLAETIDRPGRRLKLMVSPETAGNSGSSMLISLVPVGGALPCHTHPTAEEIIYVAQGTGEAREGEGAEGPSVRIEPGSALFIERGVPHSIVNGGAGEMVLVCCFTPPVTFGK